LYPVKIKEALEIVEADQLLFTSSGIRVPGNPDENLCLKAYHLIAKDVALPPVHIHLHKQIPVGAGLGGGSADAAFCIRLLNQKFSLGFTALQMTDYACQLGSDCAFFIENQPVLATGRGNQFQEINISLAKYFVVLVMPPVHINTANAYQDIKPGSSGFSLAGLENLPIEKWRDVLKNDFEVPVFKKHPAIEGIKKALYQSGALYASMSGSGASVYGIFKNEISLPEFERDNLVFYEI
jgi:4-diphosphocytidyl-2-C-methyl-D-erythritol kinase